MCAPRGDPHLLIKASSLECLQQFQQSRLVHSQRAESSRVRTIDLPMAFARCPSTSWTTSCSLRSRQTSHFANQHSRLRALLKWNQIHGNHHVARLRTDNAHLVVPDGHRIMRSQGHCVTKFGPATSLVLLVHVIQVDYLPRLSK